MEESILPRLYRQAPLNAIWEGSGNIQCLDVLRALAKEPATHEALLAEFSSVQGESALLDRAVAGLTKSIGELEQLELRSRGIVEQMAVCLQAAVLIRAGNSVVADAFCRGRLGEGTGRMFGAGVVARGAELVERAFLE